MANEAARVEAPCPNKMCNSIVVIEQNWTAGGVNDYGGYVLKCSACQTVFHMYLGRDINDSRVIGGAKVLATYDMEVGDRDEVLARYGLKAD